MWMKDSILLSQIVLRNLTKLTMVVLFQRKTVIHKDQSKHIQLTAITSTSIGCMWLCTHKHTYTHTHRDMQREGMTAWIEKEKYSESTLQKYKHTWDSEHVECHLMRGHRFHIRQEGNKPAQSEDWYKHGGLLPGCEYMHETFSLFLDNTSHIPNRHTHSNSTERQNKTSQNQNPKPAKHRIATTKQYLKPPKKKKNYLTY